MHTVTCCDHETRMSDDITCCAYSHYRCLDHRRSHHLMSITSFPSLNVLTLSRELTLSIHTHTHTHTLTHTHSHAHAHAHLHTHTHAHSHNVICVLDVRQIVIAMTVAASQLKNLGVITNLLGGLTSLPLTLVLPPLLCVVPSSFLTCIAHLT